MKTTRAALLSLFVFACLAQARAAVVAAAPPSLRLSADIVSRRYCAGMKAGILEMRLRLRYHNAGGGRLIVYRGKNLFYQTRIRGGREGARYEVVVLNSRYNDAQPEVVNSRRPGPAFVTLSAGETYEEELVVGVGVAAGAERGANSIATGEHTLQVVTSTWYESKQLADELRRRWEKQGHLWFDSVASAPVTFTIGRDDTAGACR